MILIRKTAEADLENIKTVQTRAFGYVKEAELTLELLADPSARPLLSLLAFEGQRAVGHVLFTNIVLVNENGPQQVKGSILAPLAVIPEFQNQGVGGKLIEEGLRLLAAEGVELVFVLGHPDYYPRHGFAPAGVQGLEAPYPIPKEHAGAWMALELKPGVIGIGQGRVKGRVTIARALDKPQHWRE